MKPIYVLLPMLFCVQLAFSQETTKTMKIENNAEGKEMEVNVKPWKIAENKDLGGTYVRKEGDCQMYITIWEENGDLKARYSSSDCMNNAIFDYFNPYFEDGLLHLEKNEFEPVIITYEKDGKEFSYEGLLESSYYFHVRTP